MFCCVTLGSYGTLTEMGFYWCCAANNNWKKRFGGVYRVLKKFVIEVWVWSKVWESCEVLVWSRVKFTTETSSLAVNRIQKTCWMQLMTNQFMSYLIKNTAVFRNTFGKTGCWFGSLLRKVTDIKSLTYMGNCSIAFWCSFLLIVSYLIRNLFKNL